MLNVPVQLLRREARVLRYLRELRQHEAATTEMAAAMRLRATTLINLALRRLQQLGLAQRTGRMQERSAVWRLTAHGLAVPYEVVFQHLTPELMKARLERMERGRVQQAEYWRRKALAEAESENAEDILPPRRLRVPAEGAPLPLTRAPNSIFAWTGEPLGGTVATAPRRRA